MSAYRGGPLPVKRDAAIAVVREMIANGTLKAGDFAPSAPQLAAKADCHPATAQAALRTLVADGTLARGVSATGRPRVAQPGGELQPAAEALEVALGRALAVLRRAAGMTQPDLATMLGVSTTTVAHAETGRAWQSGGFWERADGAVGGDGDLLRLRDAYRAVRETSPTVKAAPPLPPLSITVTSGGVAITWGDGTKTLAGPPDGARGQQKDLHEEAPVQEVHVSTTDPEPEEDDDDKPWGGSNEDGDGLGDEDGDA